MHNFKRAVGMTLAFLLLLAISTFAVSEVYFQSENYYYEDSKVRKQFAGTIDTVFIGSSHALRAFMPTIIDEETESNSYNLSCSLMTLYDRYVLLKKELERNPVEHVIVEVSYNAMTRYRRSEGPEGDIYTLGRLDSAFERFRFALSALYPDEYMRVYYDTLDRSVYSWKQLLRGQKDVVMQYETRGYVPVPTNDVSVSEEEFSKNYQQQQLNIEPYGENVEMLKKIIELCNDKNVKVTFMVTPLADSFNYQYTDLDRVYQFYKNICDEYGYNYYDFNLLKNKLDLFPDNTSFYDFAHLSQTGAEIFSNVVADVLMKQAAGEETDSLFYASYDEMNEARINN